MCGAGRRVAVEQCRTPYIWTTLVLLTFLKNPGRKIRVMARPVWSGRAKQKTSRNAEFAAVGRQIGDADPRAAVGVDVNLEGEAEGRHALKV